MRRFVVILGLAALFVTSPAQAQTEEPPESTVVAPSTTAATSSTTKALAPCPKTAPLGLSFDGKMVGVVDNVLELSVDRVQFGTYTDLTVKVAYPLDARFLRIGQRYFVAASLDAESKQLYSKVRPLVGTPTHCVGDDPIYTTHADGTPIDTGVLSGMTGKWDRIPMFFVVPLLAAVGVLTVLSVIRRSVWWMGRKSWRLLARRGD